MKSVGLDVVAQASNALTPGLMRYALRDKTVRTVGTLLVAPRVASLLSALGIELKRTWRVTGLLIDRDHPLIERARALKWYKVIKFPMGEHASREKKRLSKEGKQAFKPEACCASGNLPVPVEVRSASASSTEGEDMDKMLFADSPQDGEEVAVEEGSS
ncbi:hypothetical protein ACH5RR_039307 [Cinchona calisaya]|uniref:Uncharacterized protein n=1 Tax=Cinchona calisaya TaxID=153742 RepID=A0ABD2Y1B4_9GENT